MKSVQKRLVSKRGKADTSGFICQLCSVNTLRKVLVFTEVGRTVKTSNMIDSIDHT